MKRIYNALIGLAILCMASQLFAGIKGGGVSGQGTAEYIPKWNTSKELTDSAVTETGLIHSSLRVSDVVTGVWDDFGEVWLYEVYVSNAGSDETGDGTVGNPYATLQKAINETPKHVDVPHYYINVVAGTYSKTAAYTPTDPSTSCIAYLDGFYGEGTINISVSDSATLRIQGDWDTTYGGSVFSIHNTSCKVNVTGGVHSVAFTDVATAGHPIIFSVSNSKKVRIMSATFEDNCTYDTSKYSYAIQYYDSQIQLLTTVYTAGKECFRVFRELSGISTVFTDGGVTGGTGAEFYEITGAYKTIGSYNYHVLDGGLYLDDTASSETGIVTNEQLELLNTYTQTEEDLASAVSLKHSGSHTGTAGKAAMFTSENVLGDATNTDTEIAAAVSASHAAVTAGTGISLDGQEVSATLGTDVAYSEIEAATLVTEGEGIASNDNDTTIPTNAAVKDYADTNDANTTYSAGTGITLDGTTFSADVGIFRQVLSASTASDTVLYLLDGARTTFYDLTLTGDTQAETVTFNATKEPQDGDNLIIRVKASSAPYTLSLLEGGDNTFKYGVSVTSDDLTQTDTDAVDYVGCQWFDTLKKWIVLAISKGF
jgi:hypothetical protein